MLQARKPVAEMGSLQAEAVQQHIPPEDGIEPQLDAASTTASLLRGILDRLRHVEAENAALRNELSELRNPVPAANNNAEGIMRESSTTFDVLRQRIEVLERAAEHSSEEARATRGIAADEARAELRPLLDAARRAAEESAAGAATVSSAIENDVAALRVALATERAEAEAFRQKEQEKSALLFGEVVRVSNASRETDASSSENARAMAARVEALEARAVTLERALAVADERSGREGAEGELRAGQLGVQIGNLQAQFESLRTEVRAADLARERAAGEQGQWGKRLHEALARVDVSAAERIAQALVAVDGRVAQDKAELSTRIEALQNELRNSTASTHDAHEVSTKVMASRLAALESALNNEQQQRSTQQGVDRREAEGSLSDLAARFDEERQQRTTAITSLERQLIEGLEAARQSGHTTSDRLSTRLDQLEEVLRAEVQSRLKGQKQARDTQEAAAEASTRAIAAIAQESSDALRAVRDELTTQSQKQAESLEKEAESLKKMSAEHSRAQAVLQGDLSARLAVVEAAERHADEARSSLQGELSKRLEQYRGSADEMIESLSRRITAQREVLDAAIERVRVAATAEVRASEKTLAEGTARATAVLRAEMTASEQQQSRATAAVAAEGREGRLHVAARIAAAETAQTAARRSTEVERALCAMVDEIADRNSALALADAASAFSGEVQRVKIELEQRADAEARAHAEAVATCEARADKATETSTECVTSLNELSSLLLSEREQRRHERTMDAKEAAEAQAKLADDAQTAFAALEARADFADVAMTVESIVSRAIELEAVIGPVASLQMDLAAQQRETRATFDAVQSAAQQERNYARELRGRIEGVASGLDEQREHRRRAREQNEAFARALEADAATQGNSQ